MEELLSMRPRPPTTLFRCVIRWPCHFIESSEPKPPSISHNSTKTPVPQDAEVSRKTNKFNRVGTVVTASGLTRQPQEGQGSSPENDVRHSKQRTPSA